MLVRVKEMGIYQGSRMRPGVVFEFDGERMPSWCEPADAPLATKPEKKEPRTMSEINRRGPDKSVI